VLLRAKNIAAALGRPVAGWISDKQDAFVQGIVSRNAAWVLQESLSPRFGGTRAGRGQPCQVQVRRTVRGLRSIEQACYVSGRTTWFQPERMAWRRRPP